MARRNWIKIYPEGFLRRTLFDELLPIERWVWIGFLCLAGDNALDGRICVTEDMGYTDEQLAKLLDIDIDILKVSKKKMVKFKKISVDKNNVIQIISWNIYQSEYQRQRDYREEYKKKLQLKVTTESNNEKLRIDRDRDRDREEDKEEDKNKTIKGSIPYQEIKDSYNKYRNKMPEIKILSDNRKNTIRLRYKKYGDDLFTLFEKASKSDFLNGSNDRNWIANFDWLLKEANLVKVLEGNYDNKGKDERKINYL